METMGNAVVKQANVFFNRNFMLLFYGKIISQLGDQIYAFALSWYILDLTKSSLQMSLFLVAEMLMFVVVSPFGGIIADRLNRKGIMIWMDAIRGVTVLLAAFLLYHHLLAIWMLYICGMILGFCGAVFSPAASAIIPNIVEEDQLTQATSMDQFTGSFCIVTGMVISGVLYHGIGVIAIFVLNAVSYLVSGVMEAWVAIPWKKPGSATEKSSLQRELGKVVRELDEGYRYVKENKLVFNLMLMYSLLFFISVPAGSVYLPYFFNVILKATPLQLALSQGCSWIGLILGSILVPLISKRYQLRKNIFWGLLVYSLFIFLLSVLVFPQQERLDHWTITMIFMALGTVMGIAITFFNIPAMTVFQKYTADEYRGRFWGLQTAVTSFALPVGYLMGGFLAQKVWMGYLFFATAIGVFLLNLWVVNLRELKELQD
jgi:DHA3 family macrolide efflux protein-like MFS transporter